MANHKNQSTSRASLYTIGYQGLSADEFVAALKRNQISVLVDVRQRASSRKAAFSKTALRELLASNGIEYVHLPLLGTPAELRARFKEGEIELADYLMSYGEYLATRSESIEQLEQLIDEQRCCLLCVESDHKTCHRSVLAAAVVTRSGESLTVTHL